MPGFLAQVAEGAGALAGPSGGIGGFASSLASNFLQPFFDNYYQDRTTGNRADNYNMYADMTYPEDSRRMLNRLDTLYPGTTPWERLGIQPASSPSLPESRAPGSTPFLLAQMQQETALKTTQMNNETALKQTAMQTGNAMQIAEYGQTGPEAKARIQSMVQGLDKTKQDIAESKAREILTQLQGQTEVERRGLVSDQALETQTRTKGVAIDNILKPFAALVQLLPTQKLHLPGMTVEQKQNWDLVIKALRQDYTGGDSDTLRDAVIRNLGPNQIDGLQDNIKTLAQQVFDALTFKTWGETINKTFLNPDGSQ